MRMKMAAAFIVWVLLVCCSITSYADNCMLFTKVEGDVTVPLTVKMKPGFKVRWKHDDDVIFYKTGDNFIMGKEGDISSNGSLVLKNVSRGKEGKYEAEVHNKDGTIVGTSNSFLCFREPVKKPNVKPECIKTSVKFSCQAGQEKGLTISWYQNNKLLEKEKGRSITRLAEKVKDDMFKCSVSNIIFEEHSDAVKQPCYETGIMEFLDEYKFILVGVGGGVVLLLFIMVIICCIKAKRRRRMHVKDEEELRLGWTNPNQQQYHQHHHHHHHPNQQHHHHHHHRQQQQEQQQKQQQQQQQPQQRQQQRQQPAGHTGPRPHRTKQQRPRHPDPPGVNSQPSPRRPAQAPPAADEDQPPPLPQPRKKAPKTPQV